MENDTMKEQQRSYTPMSAHYVLDVLLQRALERCVARRNGRVMTRADVHLIIVL